MEILRTENLSFTYPPGKKGCLRYFAVGVRRRLYCCVRGVGLRKNYTFKALKRSLAVRKKGRQIYIGGVPHDEAWERRRFAWLCAYDPDSQIVTDKVWHELAGLENLGVDSQKIRRRVSEMASYFGIQGWFRKIPTSWAVRSSLNLAS